MSRVIIKSGRIIGQLGPYFCQKVMKYSLAFFFGKPVSWVIFLTTAWKSPHFAEVVINGKGLCFTSIYYFIYHIRDEKHPRMQDHQIDNGSGGAAATWQTCSIAFVSGVPFKIYAHVNHILWRERETLVHVYLIHLMQHTFRYTYVWLVIIDIVDLIASNV